MRLQRTESVTAKNSYWIDRKPAQAFLVCRECGHRVEVNQFRNIPKGHSKRTQAAAAMLEHQAVDHLGFSSSQNSGSLLIKGSR